MLSEAEFISVLAFLSAEEVTADYALEYCAEYYKDYLQRVDASVRLEESIPHLLVGRRGNEWSDRAEKLLQEAGLEYRFERISTPPHPNPASVEGADDDIRAIPTLLLDYTPKDATGEAHHIRTALAWGLEEIEKWVQAERSSPA